MKEPRGSKSGCRGRLSLLEAEYGERLRCGAERRKRA